MTVKQFQDMDEVDQLKVLIQFGILVGEIAEKKSRTFMYQVEDFYVEAKYTIETDELTGIESFSRSEIENRKQWTILSVVHSTNERHTH